MTDKMTRFVAAIQSKDNPRCYKHFFETNKLGQARQKAQAKHEETGCVCIIIDREDWTSNWEYIGLPPSIPEESDEKPTGKISKRKAPRRKKKS